MIQYKLGKAANNNTVYPIQVNSNHVGMENLKKEMSSQMGILGASALDEIVELIARHLSDGDTVTIDGLGTFSLRLGIAKNGVSEFDAVRSQDILVNGIRFRACKALKNRIARQEKHLQKGEKMARKITIDNRLARIRQHIQGESEREGKELWEVSITVRSYMAVTGCTTYTARTELEKFVESGIFVKQTFSRLNIYHLAK